MDFTTAMLKEFLKKFAAIPEFTHLSKEMEIQYKDENRREFARYFRPTLILGIIVYTAMIVWDWFMSQSIFNQIVGQRLGMIAILLIVFGISFMNNFYKISQNIGAAIMVILMLNVTWTQGILEKGLEEGYGMLITPGTTTSVIVFSGAEMGYGALLTPLLLLPIGFTALQAFVVSILVVVMVNLGMAHADLPEAFVNTINSVFAGICIFTTVLAYLVNQQRRTAFKLRSDLQIARDKAEEASTTKSSLIATMSHEVRNFITGIIAITSYLQKTSLDPKQQDSIVTLKYSGETLLAILNDVLDFSKIEAGKLELETIEIDSDKLIYSVTDLMRSRAEEKGVDIRITIDTQVPNIIISDPTRLRQVLMNLLSNAIKYTDNGHVGVNLKMLSKNDGRAVLKFEITDTGVGISPDAIGKLFQEYAQADASTYRKYGGTGLGLHICKRIIEIMGGEISVESVIEKGSAFWFTVPVSLINDKSSYSFIEQEPSYTIDPLKILIVEDDPIIFGYTSDLLSIDHHVAHSANTGSMALAMVSEDDFDLVLMDYHLPDMNGVEITKQIRNLDHYNRVIPIIALTGNVQDGITKEFQDAGISEYLLKPVRKDSLLKILEKYGKNKRIREFGYDDHPNSGMGKIDSMIADFGEEYTKNIVGEFITTIEEKNKEIGAFIVSGNIKDVANCAHSIASMAATIGLEQTCDMFRKVEARMNDDSMDVIEFLYHEAFKAYTEEKEEMISTRSLF